jgi:hypothetical protein
MAAETRPCEWCAELIQSDALKCPKCRKWRKDIDQDRLRAYGWGMSWVVAAGVLLEGFAAGAWKECSFAGLFSSQGGGVRCSFTPDALFSSRSPLWSSHWFSGLDRMYG